MKELKKLTDEQHQLVEEFKQLIERIENTNMGIVIDGFSCMVTFFNLDGIEECYSSADPDWDDRTTIWYNIYETSYAEVVEFSERTVSFYNIDDTDVGFKFKEQ